MHKFSFPTPQLNLKQIHVSPQDLQSTSNEGKNMTTQLGFEEHKEAIRSRVCSL